jgi:SAM-dependent methyltransferase
MTEWYADESFWKTLYPFLFPDKRMAAAADEVSRILELVDFDGRSVLDLCCGPGRHSTDLARRGYSVTGVDRSPFLLDRARESAAADKVSVEWVISDMRDFVRPEAFDLVINMFTSFGYFDDKDDDLRVLRNIHSSLRAGGCLVLETVGKEYLASVFQPTTTQEAPDGGLLIERHEIFDDWSRIRNQWIVIRDGQPSFFDFHHTIYSAQELKDRLALTGFAEIRIFGDLEGGAYGPGSERLIALAFKRGE